MTAPRHRPKLDLDPQVVKAARSLAKKAGRPIVRLAQQHTTVSVERATLRLAGLGGADPDGTPWVNRLVDAVRADVGLEHGVSPAGLGRPRAVRHRRPDHAGAEGSHRRRPLPDPRGPERDPRQVGSPQGRRCGDQADRRTPQGARAAGQEVGRPRAQAVDLPDRGDRRHLRGHPAGPGGGSRGRRHHRGDPIDRTVAARLRPRGADPGGVRGHLRHAGELPADAGGARRDERRARSLRPAHQLRLRAVHARDRVSRRARAARHDAQRLDVRDPLPRHQPRSGPSSTSASAARSTPGPASSSTPARTTT